MESRAIANQGELKVPKSNKREVSHLRATPLAILCSDIHLSEKPPIARSAEKDWLGAQKRAIEQIKNLAKKCDTYTIICAGDVFDRWNPSPSLINFAMDVLPHLYSIPGQHDLPYHRYEDIQRSAYWTLVKAGKITNIDGVYKINNQLVLHGFRWGEKVHPLVSNGKSKAIHLAMIHAYIWRRGYSYPSAPEASNFSNWNKRLRGFNAAVFGDNHKGFLLRQPHPCSILNCGTLLRRKIDEIDYHPCIGILNDDGSIVRYRLDTSEDKFISTEDDLHTVDDQDFTEFIDDLRTLADKGLNFAEILKQRVADGSIDEGVKEIIIQALEEAA